jgi:hypothetical protein
VIIKELIVEVKEGLLTIKDLSSYLKLWELMIGVGLFAFLLGWSIYTIPTLDDDGVYAADDVIVSWYCSGGGKTEFQNMIGASGRHYKMGGTWDVCSKSFGEEYYVGRKVVAYYKPGRDSPIQLDFEGGKGGYKAGIQFSDVWVRFGLWVGLIFIPLAGLASSRRRRVIKKSKK